MTRLDPRGSLFTLAVGFISSSAWALSCFLGFPPKPGRSQGAEQPPPGPILAQYHWGCWWEGMLVAGAVLGVYPVLPPGTLGGVTVLGAIPG